MMNPYIFHLQNEMVIKYFALRHSPIQICLFSVLKSLEKKTFYENCSVVAKVALSPRSIYHLNGLIKYICDRILKLQTVFQDKLSIPTFLFSQMFTNVTIHTFFLLRWKVN